MPPTESSGLLEVEDGSHHRSAWHDRHNGHHYNQPPSPTRAPLLCLSLLIAMLVVTFYVVLFTVQDYGAMTPEGQIALLNSETARANSASSSASSAGAVAVPSGCESTMILMRHCEKEGGNTEDMMGNEHCSKVGHERAEYIPTLFGDDSNDGSSSSNGNAKWPKPSYLYAMSRGRPGVHHLNYREIETLAPLRDKSGVKIDARFSEGSERKLASDYFHRLASGDLCGKVAVINWKHSRIPTMSVALGCGTEEGCPEKYHKKEFDKVWQIKFTYDGNGKDDGSSTELRKEQHGSNDGKRWSVHGTVIKEGFDPKGSSSKI